jgi:uncharacterized repeat protein (TIGR01451 family)
VQDLSLSWLAADLLHSDPAVCALGPDRLQVFWRGSSGHLLRITKAFGQNWSLPDDLLGQQLAGAPAAVSWGEDRMDVFWRNPANRLHHIWFDPFNGGWHLTPEDLGGLPDSDLSDPAVCSGGVGRLDVFWRSGIGSLVYRSFKNGGWYVTNELGGYLKSAPGCVAWSSTRIDVFGRASLPGTALQHKAWKNGPFHDFPPGVVNTVVPDQTLATGSLVEFSSAIQPPVAGNPNNPARVFFSGSTCGQLGCGVLYTADFLQDTLSPVTDVFPTQIASTLLSPGETGQSAYVPPCNTNINVMVPLGLSVDNNMTMFSDGTLMLSRLLRTDRQRDEWPETKPHALRGANALLTRALGRAATWLRKTDIDPADPDIGNGFWQAFRCTKWKDGSLVNVTNWGGWDRNEIYADPWSSTVFVSQGAARGTPPQGTEQASPLLARSDNYGTSWAYTLIPLWQPLMMTSLPGEALFVSSAAKLVWSFDGGASVRPAIGPVAVSWTDDSALQSELVPGSVALKKIEGSQQISRVGVYFKNGKFMRAVRVGYPCVKQGWQIYRIVAVHIPDDAYSGNEIWTENLLTLEVTDPAGNLVGDVMQVTMVEPIGALPFTDYNTTLMYWREERPQPDGSTNTTIKGQFLTGLHGFSKVLTLSTGLRGSTRSFKGSFRGGVTGHYSKGAYYYDEASQEARYLAQWIEAPPGQSNSLHATILGLPKIGKGYYSAPALSAAPSVFLGSSGFDEIELKWSDCLTFDCCDRCAGDQSAPASYLEVTQNLSPPIQWSTVTNAVIAGDNGQFSVRLSPSSPSAFFRLARRQPVPPTEVELIVNAMAGANGTLQPSGTLSIDPAESQTFFAVPDARFQVDAWYVDRTVVQRGGDRFTLADIATDHDLRVSFRPVYEYDLAVEASGHPAAVPVNSNLTYTVSVQNSGLRPMGEVKLVDALPRGLNFVLAEASQGACASTAGTIACDLGEIAPDATVLVTLVATPIIEGTFTNTFTVEGNVNEANLSNNSSTVITSTRPPQFRVTAVATSGGSIRPAGFLLVNPGEDLMFTAVSEPDTEIDLWYLDHTLAQVGGNTFTLRNVQADHAITTTFVEIYGD